MTLALLLASLAGTFESPAASATSDRQGSFTVAVAGDLLLARGVEQRSKVEGWDEVLAPLREALAGADASLVNLESPFGACLSPGSVERPRLCAQPQAAAPLARAGVTAVTLANNHALDAGFAGLTTTVEQVQAAGIVPLGAQAARTGKAIVERLGPIAVLSANLSRSAWPPGRTRPVPSPAEIADRIRSARASAPETPILVVLHGGREMDPTPSGFEARYAEAAVAAGAAAIVFHGAHVTHPLIRLAGVPVHLGLGNLLFDQRDARAAQGQVVLLRFRPGQGAEVVNVRCVETLTGRLRACGDAPAARP